MKYSYLNPSDLRKRGQSAKEKAAQGGTPIAINAKNQIVGLPVADNEIIIRSGSYEIKALDDEKRTIEFVITDDSVDRENDVISIDGWDTTDYSKNPVVLFGHDHYSLPVARSTTLWTAGNQMRSIAEFAGDDLYPFGAICYRMYKAGFLNAVSVGFKPLEYTYDEERKWGINFYRQSLLEYSCVPVPANANALAVARSSGLDLTPLRTWAERILDEAKRAEMPDAVRLGYEGFWREAGRHKALVDFFTGIKATEPPPPPVDARKKTVERWTCKSNHEHTTLVECEDCDKKTDAETAYGSMCASLETLAGQIRATGRTVTEATEPVIRRVMSTLEVVLGKGVSTTEVKDDTTAAAPAAVLVTETTPKSDVALYVGQSDDNTPKAADDGTFTLPPGIDEAALTAAVANGVQAAVNRITGRVD